MGKILNGKNAKREIDETGKCEIGIPVLHECETGNLLNGM